MIEQVLMTRDTAEWLPQLDEAGIPASKINNVADIMQHPQMGPRQMLVTVDDPTFGEMTVAGNPIKLSGFTDDGHRNTAPDVDGDRERIVREFVG